MIHPELPDQKVMWDQKHGRGEHATFADTPSDFAVAVEATLPAGSHILDLGCGVGADARYFAAQGHEVVATDFSRVVIEQNQARPQERLRFLVGDMTEPLPFADEALDVVYAHLSLHDYSDAVTKQIVREISRVLKPGGCFFFRCKSIHSPEYGEGTEIEPNTFVRRGHVRHLFTEQYAREILGELFTVDKLMETEGLYTEESVHFIDCWATKREAP